MVKISLGKVDKFDITVEVAPLPIKLPCAGEKWFMKVVIESGVTCGSELILINKFHCHQQGFFVSDVLDNGGRARITNIGPLIIFLIENPPQRYLKLWQQVLYSLAPRGWVHQSIGRFSNKGLKIWELQ